MHNLVIDDYLCVRIKVIDPSTLLCFDKING